MAGSASTARFESCSPVAETEIVGICADILRDASLSACFTPSQSTSTMPKRKREDGADGASEGSPEPVVDAKQRRLQLKLEQGTVKLGHAFKGAKGFERQKLGRRQKTAASAKNEKDAQRIEAEITALKVHYAATVKQFRDQADGGIGT